MTTHPQHVDATELVATYIPELPAERLDHICGLVSRALEGTVFAESAPFVWPGDAVGRDPEFESLLRDMAVANLATTRRALQASPVVADCEHVLSSFVTALAEGLARTLLRTFVAFLHADEKPWRIPTCGAEENFDRFVRFLRQPEGQAAFTQRHSQSVAAAGRLVRRYAELIEELLDRIAASLPELAALPWGPTPGSGLVDVSLDAGDTHDDGRTVAILTFGDGRRIVLKPRDTRIEAAYNDLICWCNDAGVTDLPTIGQLVRDEYGFSEFITAPAVPDRDERFYTQIGQLLAVHHLLGGNDVHYENLILDSEGRPIVVDAETLLAPRKSSSLSPVDDHLSDSAREAIASSVLGVGILPTRLVSADPNVPALDIGAVGYRPGQQSPFRVVTAVNSGREDMSLVLSRIALGDESPVREERLDPSARRDAIREGLERTLTAISDEAAFENVVRGLFAGLSARQVLIPTVYYAQLLRMCTHPTVIEDDALRLTICHRVALVSGGRTPAAARLVDSLIVDEVRQLMRGDVPSYWHQVDALDLRSGDGQSVIEGFFAISGLELALERIRALGPSQVAAQLDLVDLAFAADFPQGSEITGFTLDDVRPDSYVEVASIERAESALVRRLTRDAIADPTTGRPSTWIAPLVSTENNLQWSPGVIGNEPYGGASSPALVLAAYARRTGDDRARRAALGVLRPLATRVMSGTLEGPEARTEGLVGLPGICWVLSTAADMVPLPEVDRLTLMRRIAEQEPFDSSQDVIAGSAGSLLATIAIAERWPEGRGREALTLVGAVAERLSEAVDSTLRGADGASFVEFTGFAHGVAGVIPALLADHRWTGSERSLEQAVRLQDWLDDQYCREFGDWPRTVGTAERSYGWCHGAPGILLSRLSWYGIDDARLSSPMLSRLIELTRDHGLGSNVTYCHGDLGSLEALSLADRTLGAGATADFFLDAVHSATRRDLDAAAWHRTNRHHCSPSITVGSLGGVWARLRAGDPQGHPSPLYLVSDDLYVADRHPRNSPVMHAGLIGETARN